MTIDITLNELIMQRKGNSYFIFELLSLEADENKQNEDQYKSVIVYLRKVNCLVQSNELLLCVV